MPVTRGPQSFEHARSRNPLMSAPANATRVGLCPIPRLSGRSSGSSAPYSSSLETDRKEEVRHLINALRQLCARVESPLVLLSTGPDERGLKGLSSAALVIAFGGSPNPQSSPLGMPCPMPSCCPRWVRGLVVERLLADGSPLTSTIGADDTVPGSPKGTSGMSSVLAGRHCRRPEWTSQSLGMSFQYRWPDAGRSAAVLTNHTRRTLRSSSSPYLPLLPWEPSARPWTGSLGEALWL